MEDGPLEKVVFEPIGVIRTPFKTRQNMPVQPSGGKGVEGVVEVDPRYQEGLSDLDGFSHIYLIYHFHKASGYALKVVPFIAALISLVIELSETPRSKARWRSTTISS